jgi:predicted MFS family arabinose efflux permease
MGRDLRTPESGLQQAAGACSLVLAGFLVLAGSTADRVGRRRVFQIDLAVFGLGSLLCGLAPGIGWLIAARALQAVGGTMLNPATMAIVANTFTGTAERARAIGVFGSMSGLALALGPILGGGLVDAFGWRSVFWINVPVVAAAIVCAALFVPESRAMRARRFDPVGQVLMVLVLGSVYAIIESASLGWTSPLIAGLLSVAAPGAAGIGGYEPRRADPLLESRLFRSVPFTPAIVTALLALRGPGAFLPVTTRYPQNVRGLPPVTAGLCLLPAGLPVLAVSPLTGRVAGGRGPLLPLTAAGTALAPGGGVPLRPGPAAPLLAVPATCPPSGVFPGAVNPPVTNPAISGMPRSMAGLAGSPASAGRQAGTTSGAAISGTNNRPAPTRGGTAFTSAAHGVWRMVVALGAGIVVPGPASTGRRASRTAARAAALFERVDAPIARK